MKRESISTLEITTTYIGTIIGAGFASGQEILQFFVQFGREGLYGLILTTLLLIIYGYIIMVLGRKLNTYSYTDIIKYSAGQYIGTAMDIMVSFFLFSILIVMLAGTGALLHQQFNLPYMIGNLLMMVLTIIVVLRGIDGIIHSMRFIVPFLLVSVLLISTFSIAKTPPNLDDIIIFQNSSLIKNWWTSAIIFTSYNIIIAIGILSSLGIKAKNENTIKWGAIKGGISIGGGAMMIFFVLLVHAKDLQTIEIPMAYIAGYLSPNIQVVYTGVLLVAIFTTAVSSLYGTVKKVTHYPNFENQENKIIIVAAIVAFLLSQLGFSNLVKYLYAVEGYVGVILLVGLTYGMYKLKKN